MPYVITTRPPHEHMTVAALGHRAVATLEEAQMRAHKIAQQHSPGLVPARDVFALEALPGGGGTVGPLPDGTVIEVARVTYCQLAGYMKASEIIDAYNAREASS